METSFSLMSRNLSEYRKFLPEDLLYQVQGNAEKGDVTGAEETAAISAVPPPGMESHVVTVAFTDIVSSTSLWECDADTMALAIKTHNTIIRDVIRTCLGYEVKTVGDAFVVAFEKPADGIAFGLSVQSELQHSAWPEELLCMPLCAPRTSGPWGGLTVRIGVNSGPITPEENPVTKRVDYFGHTMNVAARLEGVCPPGAVCVMEGLWEQHGSGVAGAVSVGPKDVSLKGVKEKVGVMHLWDLSLRDRRHFPFVIDARKSSLASSRAQSQIPDQTSGMRSQIRLKKAHATVGIIWFTESRNTSQTISANMDDIRTNLTRTQGSLVTVIGWYIAVAWNLARNLDSHAENGIRFATRLRRTAHIGLVTANVLHGDVGSAKQRFMNVLGSVRPAWQLCEAAIAHDLPCLYKWEAPTEATNQNISTALIEQVVPRTTPIPSVVGTVYELRTEDEGGLRVDPEQSSNNVTLYRDTSPDDQMPTSGISMVAL